MSQLLSPTVAHAEPLEQAPAKRAHWNRWPKWILLLLALLWVADAGISLLIQHTQLRGRVTRRLEAAFGRPVEVGSYDFSLWNGPSLNAQSVTVAEDPRFGHEYFLHAESLNIRLLWSSLLRGRIGLGTLSLTRPSLNLVRDANGDWNISEWLPRPAENLVQNAPSRIGPRYASSAFSFRRIEITGGRINFKRGDEKLPYALADVSGAVEAQSQSRWRIDLDADPWRAATILQQAGTLHLSGDVGGTSSRLLPAALQLSWSDASLPDVLRLARGDDSGLRGTLAAYVNAATEGENWNFQVRTELRQIHRWDLTLRPDNPAVNIMAKMQWNPRVSALELTDATIEAPHSHARVAGKIAWGQTETPQERARTHSDDAQLQVLYSAIDLQDFLSWTRAFRSGISDEIALKGFVGVQMSLDGWPPRIEQGGIATTGAELSAAGLRVPIHLGPATIQYVKNAISLSPPAVLSFGNDPSALRVDGVLAWLAPAGRKSSKQSSHLHVTGKIAQVRDLTATTGLLGWSLSRGWDVAGPVLGDLQWQGGPFPWDSQPKGFIEWGGLGVAADGASLRLPFLNQPVAQIAARVDFKPGATHVALTSAQAFGARWSGTLDHNMSPDGWRFRLSGDHLAAADLNDWLNPRSRENFLDRMLPFLNGRSQATAAPEGLHASGHIALNQFTLAPLEVRGLEGDLALDGRHIALANASGQLYGGRLDGSFDANLQTVPVYRVDLDFSRADLSPLLAASPGLSILTADSASGSASFTARGATRGDLLASLTCDGKLNTGDLGLSNFDLLGSLRTAETQSGASSFQNASAAFSCTRSQILFQDLQLGGSSIRLGGSGTVDFSRNLNLRLRVLSDDTVGPRLAKSPAAPGQLFQLSGTLAAPQVKRVVAAPTRRVR